jgi:hypothetical protein
MAPGLAAMVGAGAVALAALARRGGWRLALPVAAGGATLAAQLVLLHQESYLGWYVPVLIAGIAAATVAMVLRRRRAPIAMAAIVGLLLVAPTAFSSTTWSSPVSGTFPAAGARQGPDRGPLGPPGGRDGRSSSTKLASFLRSHAPHTKFQLLTQSSMTASSLIVDGLRVGSMGGFNGDDPALDARGLARLLERGQARYVEVGGAFPGRGGNSATAAVQKVCTKVPSGQYQGSALARQSSAAGGRPGRGRGPFGAQTLYDCGASSARIAALAS